MIIKHLGIPARTFGEPIPVAPDTNAEVAKINELVDAVNAGLATSNAIVGGPKYVRYTSSQYYNVPADALTLDRLDASTILPGNVAVVINPAASPLTTTEASQQYVAAIVPATTAGAVQVPAYSGAPAGTTVAIQWQAVSTADSFTKLLASELPAGKEKYAGLELRPLLIAIIEGLGSANTIVVSTPAPPASLAPTVTGFLPGTASIGATVTVTGSRFTKATAVLFNGTAASFQVLNATTIIAVVPPSATTGPVAVATSAGTGTSATDFVIGSAAANNAPTVSLGSPQAGQTLTVGDMVVLNASPLDADGANDIKRVSFLDNGVPFAETTGAPHTVQRSLTNGSHSFTARVYDMVGASGLSNAIAISAAVSSLPDLVLLLGDSLTYGNDDPANSYGEKLKPILGASVEVRNLGVNGQPISQALQGQSVLGSLDAQIAAIDRSKYRRIVAVVDGGVNDARLLAQNYPGQDAVALTFAARKAAHQKLVAAGIPTIALNHSSYNYPASGGQISPALNTAIRATAQEEDKYIGAYWKSELLAQAFVNLATNAKIGWATPDATYFKPDGVHFEPIGSLEKANMVAPAIQAVLAGNSYGVVTPLAFNNTVVLQDTSSAITYGPGWFFADASGGTPDAFVYSGGTAHVAQNAGTPLYADVVIPIDCAELEYWLIDYVEPLSVDLSVGGGAATTIRVAAVPANTNSVNKRTITGPFTAGQVLHVASTPGANDAHAVLDKIAFNRQAVPPVTAPGHTYATAGSVEEGSLSWEYEGSWSPASGFPNEYGTDGVGKNNTSGTGSATLYFNGTKAEYWSFSHPGSSDFFVSIDGGSAIAITGVATQETSASKPLYTTPTLAAGNHSMRIIPKGSGMLTVARGVVY